MRLALLILLALHGAIHLVGFLKAFNISEFAAINQFIPQSYGLLWLLTFFLFLLTALFILFDVNYWWLCGFVAVILSQLLIFSIWSDAKYGSIANLIILLPLIVGFSQFNFKNKIQQERQKLFENTQSITEGRISKEQFAHLPEIVQKWLTKLGVVGKKAISSVYLHQDLQLQLKAEQSEWLSGKAEQYFSIKPAAFHWNIKTQMNPFMDIVGRDKFENGQGQMLIKLWSFIPLAKAKNDLKVDQATLQRYLAEIVWFPTAALSPYISWSSLDEYSAKATMEYRGVRGSGEFYFDKDGNFQKFMALRYKDAADESPSRWIVNATNTKEMNGFKIPVSCEVSWEEAGKEWTWLKLKITDIQYNIQEMPRAYNEQD